MKNLPDMIVRIGVVITLVWIGSVGQVSAQDPTTIPLEWQVIQLTNEVRAELGLSPLAYNPLLTRSARGHSRDMAEGEFFAHDNPLTGTEVQDRTATEGYSHRYVGENIAAGYPSAEEAVEGWINSPGHYANMTNPNFTEIGVGYFYRDNDPQNYGYFWTQNFGSRPDYFPIVIEGEAYLTTDPLVDVYVYGDNATEMRIGLEGQPFSEWQPFQSQVQFTLPTESATYTVVVETRDASNTIRRAADQILLVGDTSAFVTSTPASSSLGFLPSAVPPVATFLPTPTLPSVATPVPLPPNFGQAAPAATLNPDEPSQVDQARRWDWWLILPLLMLGLILLFHLLHFLSSREIWMWDRTLHWLCRIPRVALVLYALLMAGVIGHLSRGLWAESGKIIWQIDTERSTFALFDDYTASLRQLHSFEDENFSCVGCHVFSPESERMVFTTERMTGEVYQWDGSVVEALDFQSSYMAFSPDGQRLAVALNDEDLYIYDFADQSLSPVEGATDSTYIETMPAWSEDGNSLIFARSETPVTGLDNRLSIPLDLFFVPVAGGQINPLVGASEAGVFEYYPTISPDGRWVAFTRHAHQTTYADPLAEVWVISVTGGTASRLAANDTADGIPTTGNGMTVWSRDSNWLAFGTLRQDSTMDVIVSQIAADGSSAIPYALQGASERAIFENRPMWWLKPAQLSWWEFLQNAFFWLLPLIPLLMLVRLGCWGVEEEEEITWQSPPPPRPIEPAFISPKKIDVLWQPQATLVIGLGASGRHVLTQLKKNLLDAGLGSIPQDIALLAITTGKQNDEQRSRFRFADVELDSPELLLWADNLVDLVRVSDDDAALHEWVDKSYLLGLGDNALDPQTGLDQQRLLGRLVLLNNLRGQIRQTGHSLWDRLKELARTSVGEHQRLNVILITETGDDVASGQFIDVAYLLRLFEQQEELEMRLVTHVITDRALSRENSPSQQTNTIAFLRELARFQLANNTPQMMKYSAGSEDDSEFDSIFRDRLIDELYVYDGEKLPQPLNTLDPKYGLYPAIADFVGMWMDTALYEGGLSSWRSSHLRETHEQQRSRRELMVSSAGVYQYRLPFADLLNGLTLTYAAQVLHMLLWANQSETTQLDASLASEVFIQNQNPQNLALAFLRGEFGGASNLTPAWGSLINALVSANQEDAQKALRKLKPLTETDEQALRFWLGNALTVWLNGKLGASATEKRGAKLALVLEIVRRLGEPHQGIIAQLPKYLPASSKPEPLEIAQQGLERFIALTQEIYAQLQGLAESLAGLLDRRNSLYGLLQQERDRMQAIWDEYSRIKTRTYILQDRDEALLDVWYKRYMLNHVADGLEQLYWRWTDGGLELVLRLAENENEETFNPADRSIFKDALLRLGRYFATEVRKQESLASLLQENDLNRDNIQNSAARLLDYSNVLLSIDAGLAPSLDKSLLSAFNLSADQADLLEQHLRNLARAEDLLHVSTTNPFSLALVQIADSIPLSGLPTVQSALDQYNRDEEIYQYTGGVTKPSAIFAAEANALRYERRLRILEEARRVFHPVVVSGLVNDERVRIYLLAAVVQQEWLLGSDLRFNAPEWQGTLLEARHLNNPVHGVLMDGLLSFVQLIRDDVAHRIYQRYMNDDRFLERWDQWDRDHGQDWRDRFASRMPVLQILEDLISITRIIINELLEE